MSETWKHWQDWLTVVIGVLLFIAPFAFGATANQPAAWTAYAGGVLLAVVGLWNLSSPTRRITEWAEVVVGVLLFVALWVFGFTDLTQMAWSTWIAGILAVVLGGSVVLNERGGRQVAAVR